MDLPVVGPTLGNIPGIPDVIKPLFAKEYKYLKPYFNSTVIDLFLPLLLASLSTQKHAPRTKNDIDSEYDFIIVGAGSGGSTVAARLSEISDIKILLLEAGKSAPYLTEVPALNRLFIGTDIDWSFYTEPQNFTGKALNGKRCGYPAGKGIGGSSIINAMIFMHGHSSIYDKWAEEGATGWSFDKILPYFKKLQNVVNKDLVEEEYHGFHGPLTVSKPQFNSHYKSAIVEQYAKLGYHHRDVNGKYQKGIYDYLTTTRNGQRCSVAKAYLVKASTRSNLHIKENSFVTKILIENGKAIGVQFRADGKEYKIFAKKEVILSAGAVNTPKLLMLSGIGPKEHLEEMKIPLKANLPVGQNLQDHVTCILPYYSRTEIPLFRKVLEPIVMGQYMLSRSGILSSSTLIQYISLLTSNLNSPPEAIPDFELYFIEALDKVYELTFNVKKEAYEQFHAPYKNDSIVWCLIQNTHSKSRGYIKLRSKDPYENPIIDPQFFSDTEGKDRSDMIAGMKECDRVILSKPFEKLGVKPFETAFPGCESSKTRIEYFHCLSESFAFTISHQSGTAKMGNPDSASTVVDPYLRVKGIERLRVVDASVMPKIPSGNTNVPVIMIGEKAADIIKSTWGLKNKRGDENNTKETLLKVKR